MKQLCVRGRRTRPPAPPLPSPLGRGPVPAHGVTVAEGPVPRAARLAGVALDAAAGTSGLFKSAAELIESIIGKQADLGLVLVNAGVAGGGHRDRPSHAARRWPRPLKIELVS